MMMLNSKLIIAFSITVILAFALPSMVLAASDKDYCYDQVGDGHPCFDTKQKCRQEQKSDDVAESPCYNKDRAL